MRLARTTSALLATGLLAAGCGSDGGYANDARPAAPLTLTASITDDTLRISPARVGGGPIEIIIANLTDKTHRVTVESDELGAAEGGLRQRTAPINPQGTAKLNLVVKPGRYDLSTGGKAIAPAKLRVGHARPSSQNQLLLP